MVPEAIVKQARPTTDEAVRRIREESRRRVAERNRWKAFSSWCALATLASGISLAALDAREARLQAAADAAATTEQIRVESMAAAATVKRDIEDRRRSCGVDEPMVWERAVMRARALQALEYPEQP